MFIVIAALIITAVGVALYTVLLRKADAAQTEWIQARGYEHVRTVTASTMAPPAPRR